MIAMSMLYRTKITKGRELFVFNRGQNEREDLPLEKVMEQQLMNGPKKKKNDLCILYACRYMKINWETFKLVSFCCREVDSCSIIKCICKRVSEGFQ